MQIPPQITFEGSEPSAAARSVITKEIERLETHNERITGCRVTVIAPSHKHRHGTGFEVHISLTIPPHGNIVVNHAPSGDAMSMPRWQSRTHLRQHDGKSIASCNEREASLFRILSASHFGSIRRRHADAVQLKNLNSRSNPSLDRSPPIDPMITT
jgi:ribosome-associated translation inhibitor RaiA